MSGRSKPPLPGALPLKGARGKRKEPRWVVPFLRALERTGEARAAAKDAGIDHTTAYARRRAHADFAEAWAEALRAHDEAKRRAEDEEIAALKEAAPSPGSPAASPTSPARGRGDVVMSGGKAMYTRLFPSGATCRH